MVVTLEDLLKQLQKKNNNGIYTANKNSSATIDGSKYKVLYIKGLNEADKDSLQYSKDGRNLIVSYNDKKYTILKYFSNDEGSKTGSKLKSIRFDDSTKDFSIIDSGVIKTYSDNFSVSFPIKKGVVSGTVFSDKIDMKDGLENALNSKGKGLTINSGKGNDEITGTKFNDTISGGAGINTYNYDFSVPIYIL